ncbi:hypothetical protein JW964_21230 [candidate division KSB1 bacterium]|nr:hypothetical protein [candidate division KSB1 bacterium]
MKTDLDIKREGFQALKEKLDLVEIERFIVILNREKFDYTKWRKNLFEDMSLEELADTAEKYSQNLKDI